MNVLKALSLHTENGEWQGTAAQLATKLNELLPLFGLERIVSPDVESDAGSANERLIRLIRYYVAEGVLSDPAPRGRERLFGFTQIVEFMVARRLLKDGWPLAKVRELIRSASDIEGMVQLSAPAHEPTAAEKALARIRSQSSPEPAEASSRHARVEKPGALWASESSSPSPPAMGPQLPSALERAADLTQRRTKLHADLKSIGDHFGQPDRQPALSISLTPWCRVLIDLRHLATMDSTTPRVLGDALASALEEERLNIGDLK